MKNIFVLPTNKPSRLYVRNDVTPPFYSNFQGDAINIYIISDGKIKEGENYLNGKHIYKADEFYQKAEKDKKIILTTDQDLIKDGVQAIDDDFLEWFVKNPSCESVEVTDYMEVVGVETDANGYREMDVLKRIYKTIIPKEDLSYTTKSGIKISDEMVRTTMIPKEYFGKEEFTRKIDTCYNFNQEIGCVQADCRCEKEEPKKYSQDDYFNDEFGEKKEPKQETLEDKIYQSIGLATNEYGIINQALATENVMKIIREQSYSEEDMKQFGLYLGDNFKKLKSKIIDELFEQFKKK